MNCIEFLQGRFGEKVPTFKIQTGSNTQHFATKEEAKCWAKSRGFFLAAENVEPSHLPVVDGGGFQSDLRRIAQALGWED